MQTVNCRDFYERIGNKGPCHGYNGNRQPTSRVDLKVGVYRVDHLQRAKTALFKTKKANK